MQSLEFVAVPQETLRAIAERHHLGVTAFAGLPQIGIINAIYALGDQYVLRVPREHPGCIAQARAEAIAAPLARAVGVRTPPLVVFTEADDLLPAPYLIFERVPGRTLGLLDWEPETTPSVWWELGRDLALLHSVAPDPSLAAQLPPALTWPDPRELAEQRATDGWFTSMEARWWTRWLDRIAVPAASQPTPRLLHLDAQATNIIVAENALTYRALLDWGCAGLGDPTYDFFGFPLRAVPYVLAGHRSVSPLDDDANAEARILWRQVQYVLAMLPRGAAPGMSWGERPLAWLLEVFRFFQGSPAGRWRELRP